jgi:glyoxylase-like metal-dependent hydrolase (beta-lactamase superfamily II)
MYELIKIAENSYYIQSPAKIGLVRTGPDTVCLIDSGNDKDAGKKIKRILDAEGWKLEAIYNTHSHADHIGGNQYLQKQTHCKAYAPGIEQGLSRHPILEPAFLYGANPPAELRHKFLMAQESEVTPFSHPDFPKEVEIIPLPGHYFDMVGFRMPDGCVFLADCISSRATLEKYAVSFIYDVQAYLDTLDMVGKMEASIFVPSHADAAADLTELIQFNREKVHEVAQVLMDICAEPLNFEVILQRLFKRYNLTMTMQQYVLVGSTVKSYLSWLKDSGRMCLEIQDNLLLWKTI